MEKSNKEKIYISSEEVEGRIPLDDSPTKVYIMNHIIEMTIMERKRKRGCAIRKIDKDHYVVESTGEIKKFKAKDGNAQKQVNMNGRFTALKRLVNQNFVGNDSELHIVLTYEKEMYDREKASSDFKAFWKKLKFYNKHLEYIVIYEPTKKGSWHIHLLVKDIREHRFLYLPKEHLEKIWNKGYVYVSKIWNNDDIGAYFLALISRDKENPKSKGKVERLKYYTQSYRLFSRSKGIQAPPCFQMTYAEAQKLVEGIAPCYEKAYGVYATEDDRELNVIYRKNYNKKKTDKNRSKRY